MSQMFNKDYWSQRYSKNEIGWDAGSITTPIKVYVDQIVDKEIKILIPGAGNAHEAEYLWENGFKNIYILDIVEIPLQNFKKRIPDFPVEQLLLGDFFELKDQFDLIIEQTFFCALSPNLRTQYANQMQSLLKPTGKIVGVLFDFPLTEQGPPFGGSYEEYFSLFSSIFVVKKLAICENSIKPRAGKEFFIILEKQ